MLDIFKNREVGIEGILELVPEVWAVRYLTRINKWHQQSSRPDCGMHTNIMFVAEDFCFVEE